MTSATLMTTDRQPPPWYRQAWPWFLIALPLSAVIGSLYSAYLAVRTADGLVVDDFAKRGLAVSPDVGRLQQARALGLSGRLYVDGLTAGAPIELELRSSTAPPDRLIRLRWVHPGRATGDRVAILQRAEPGSSGSAARYIGAWDAPVRDSDTPGAQRYVLDGENWRVDIDVPSGSDRPRELHFSAAADPATAAVE